MTGNPEITEQQITRRGIKESAAPLLKAEALECVRSDMVLFTGLNFQLTAGELLQVVGPNGSGKTSLLRIICGLASPDEGRVYWNGYNIREYKSEFLREINYVGYHNGIKEELSPRENLNIARVLMAPKQDVSAAQMLKKFGLSGYEDMPVRKLSSGQRRRVALARLLLSSARLWVLDEPFTALDEQAKQLIKEIIENHVNGGGMVMLATHDPVAFSNCKLNKIQLSR